MSANPKLDTITALAASLSERGREADASAELAREEAQRLSEELGAARQLAETAVEEREKVEAEMRLVLKAMDAQKAAANRNLSQLSKIYEDWSSAASP